MWGPVDNLLALAHTLYQRMLCPHCGHPLSVCRSDDVEFDAVEDTCHAKEAVDQWHKDQRGDPTPGVVVSPVLDDSPVLYGGPPEGW